MVRWGTWSSSMLGKKFLEFGKILQKDPHLQKQLQSAKNEESFVKLYCQLAKQKGYEISEGEVKEYLRSVKKNFAAMSDENIKNLAAGGKVAGCNITGCLDLTNIYV